MKEEKGITTSNELYSQLDDKNCLSAPVTSMFSTPGRNHDKTYQSSPLHTYATVDTSKIKGFKSKECEKNGQEAPRILEKNS